MGNRLNLTLLDKDNIEYYRRIKDLNDFTWDEVLRRHRFSDLRQTRSTLLDLEFVNLISWIRIAYPDRPDLEGLMERIRAMITNPIILKSPDLVNVLTMRVENLHGEMVKAHKLHEDQQNHTQDERSRVYRDPRMPKEKMP